MSFLGQYEHTIDPKGRTSVPASFRELLACDTAGLPVLTISDSVEERRLLLHPPQSWRAFEEKLATRNPSEPGIKQILRTLVAFATRVEIDKMGRILVPPKLREWAELDKDVLWVGQMGHVELWSTPNWKKALEEASSPEAQALRDAAYAGLR